MQVSTWMGDRLVVFFLLFGTVSAMSLTLRSEALPLHKLYACVSSNSNSDSSETTSQVFVVAVEVAVVRIVVVVVVVIVVVTVLVVVVIDIYLEQSNLIQCN